MKLKSEAEVTRGWEATVTPRKLGPRCLRWPGPMWLGAEVIRGRVGSGAEVSVNLISEQFNVKSGISRGPVLFRYPLETKKPLYKFCNNFKDMSGVSAIILAFETWMKNPCRLIHADLIMGMNFSFVDFIDM